MDGGDVRVVERGEHARLVLEHREPLGIPGERLRQNLDRDVPIELLVARQIDRAHRAGTERRPHEVCAETSPDGHWHERTTVAARCGSPAAGDRRAGCAPRTRLLVLVGRPETIRSEPASGRQSAEGREIGCPRRAFERCSAEPFAHSHRYQITGLGRMFLQAIGRYRDPSSPDY